MRKRKLLRALARVGIAVLVLAGAAIPAQGDPVADAEALVRAIYYEGPPEDATLALEDDGVARLAEMLMDAEEAPHHGNIVSVLAMSAHPGAFDALAAYAAQPLQGEVDRNTFRARSRLAGAMGRLAHDDRRALGWLLRRSADRSPPAWTFRHQRDAKLASLLEAQTLSGLAYTGAPEALAVLQRAQQEGRDVARVIETHARVARDGVDALREGTAR